MTTSKRILRYNLDWAGELNRSKVAKPEESLMLQQERNLQKKQGSQFGSYQRVQIDSKIQQTISIWWQLKAGNEAGRLWQLIHVTDNPNWLYRSTSTRKNKSQPPRFKNHPLWYPENHPIYTNRNYSSI